MSPDQTIAVLYAGKRAAELEQDRRDIEDLCRRIGASEVFALARIIVYEQDLLRETRSYTLR